jgi:hypothetical protein
MWSNILFQTFISILIIFCIHHLVIYCKTTFTTKKTKDIVAIHTQKYQDVLNNVQENNEREMSELIDKLTMMEQSEKTLTDTDIQAMHLEMEDFVKNMG